MLTYPAFLIAVTAAWTEVAHALISGMLKFGEKEPGVSKSDDFIWFIVVDILVWLVHTSVQQGYIMSVSKRYENEHGYNSHSEDNLRGILILRCELSPESGELLVGRSALSDDTAVPSGVVVYTVDGESSLSEFVGKMHICAGLTRPTRVQSTSVQKQEKLDKEETYHTASSRRQTRLYPNNHNESVHGPHQERKGRNQPAPTHHTPPNYPDQYLHRGHH